MLCGFSPQQAVDAPRFCISAGPGDIEAGAGTTSDINSESTVFFEDTLDPAVLDKLQGKHMMSFYV